jgi:hypothetical protein
MQSAITQLLGSDNMSLTGCGSCRNVRPNWGHTCKWSMKIRRCKDLLPAELLSVGLSAAPDGACIRTQAGSALHLKRSA